LVHSLIECLQDGVATTGVSVAFTVLKCDAGPIFLQETAAVPEDEQAPELLHRLFKQGAQLLVNNMERVWSGEAAQMATQQDEAQATHAAKVSWHDLMMPLAGYIQAVGWMSADVAVLLN
jgi:methionyl-tRNA formyltransferase